MPWTVKNEDGSLDFQTLGDVEKAYRLGLVDPSDELHEHGKTAWRRAGDHPALRHSAPKKRGVGGMSRQLLLGVGLSVGFAVVALVLIARGQWMLGLAMAAGITFFLMRFNRRVVFGASAPVDPRPTRSARGGLRSPSRPLRAPPRRLVRP